MRGLGAAGFRVGALTKNAKNRLGDGVGQIFGTQMSYWTGSDRSNSDPSGPSGPMTVLARDWPKVSLLDGGTGEELFKRGLQDDRKIWSANALVDQPIGHELLVQVHQSFLRAGSDFITCNNYGVTPGVGFSEEEMIKLTALAGQLAVRARQEFMEQEEQQQQQQQQHQLLQGDLKRPAPIRICGSLPPLLESYRPDRVLPHEEGVHKYSLIASTLSPYVDVFLAETLSCFEEASQALTGAQEFDKPLMVSFTLQSDGRTIRSGESVVEIVNKLLVWCRPTFKPLNLQAILFNCSLPEAVTRALKEINKEDDLREELKLRHIRLGAYANRLTPIASDWALAENAEPQAMRKDLQVDEYTRFVLQWIDLGAEMVGGCCGIGPEYIQDIHRVLQSKKLR